MCVTNVYTLTSLTTSLNVTMVVTLRKFLSMVLSILIFKNPFTILHCLGFMSVMFGSLAFTVVDLNSFPPFTKKNL
ncbi:unnamed protein product [Gongylonema pulchrum]|uniref:TPT domain-containing protein n=1 Tax=Gongylonema pulchrum TaxID=637853 RepID=A0A183D2T9_9BILA|nr:unnamed protein product [Gongylonema pulchrum]